MRVPYDRLCELGLIRPGCSLGEIPELDGFLILDVQELRETKQRIIICAAGPDVYGEADVRAVRLDAAVPGSKPVPLSREEARGRILRLLRIADAEEEENGDDVPLS